MISAGIPKSADGISASSILSRDWNEILTSEGIYTGPAFLQMIGGTGVWRTGSSLMPTNVLSSFLQSFRLPDRQPSYTPPPSVSERQLERDQQLSVLQKLRAARLGAHLLTPESGKRKAPTKGTPVIGAEHSPSAEASPCFRYDVVRHRGHWRVRHIGRNYGTHANSEAAVKAAIKLAAKKQRDGHLVAVRLHRTDGQIIDISAS
jgi:hypothetical protein